MQTDTQVKKKWSIPHLGKLGGLTKEGIVYIKTMYIELYEILTVIKFSNVSWL